MRVLVSAQNLLITGLENWMPDGELIKKYTSNLSKKNLIGFNFNPNITVKNVLKLIL